MPKTSVKSHNFCAKAAARCWRWHRSQQTRAASPRLAVRAPSPACSAASSRGACVSPATEVRKTSAHELGTNSNGFNGSTKRGPAPLERPTLRGGPSGRRRWTASGSGSMPLLRVFGRHCFVSRQTGAYVTARSLGVSSMRLAKDIRAVLTASSNHLTITLPM
jgi:hypothetical protein